MLYRDRKRDLLSREEVVDLLVLAAAMLLTSLPMGLS